MDDYENILEKLSCKSKNHYFLGDFNIDTKLSNKLTRSFIHLNQSYGFSIAYTQVLRRE